MAGPERKVYRTTEAGRERLEAEARRRLSRPRHPRNELDLGVYALPFLPRERALAAIGEGIDYLEERLALHAELTWLRRLHAAIESGAASLKVEDWQRYEYLDPPDLDA